MANPNRGSRGKFVPDPNTPNVDARVMDMWSRGYTQDEIRQEIGWANTSSVSKSIDRAYKSVVAPHVDAARKRSLDRLDHAYRKARRILDDDHVMVSQGRAVKHPDTGVVLHDVEPRIKAIDRIVKIEQRMAAIYGFDSPVKHSVDMVTRDVLVEQMEKMAAELERNPESVTEDDVTPEGADQ